MSTILGCKYSLRDVVSRAESAALGLVMLAFVVQLGPTGTSAHAADETYPSPWPKAGAV